MTTPVGGERRTLEQGTKQAEPAEVRDFHRNSDVDSSSLAQHHTLGVTQNTAAEGSHNHNGSNSRKIALTDVSIGKPTVTGSRGANAALGSLLNQLEALGLIINNTTV